MVKLLTSTFGVAGLGALGLWDGALGALPPDAARVKSRQEANVAVSLRIGPACRIAYMTQGTSVLSVRCPAVKHRR